MITVFICDVLDRVHDKAEKKGTSNWFHFAIPSATKIDDDNVSHYHAWLRAQVNNDAVIDRVHVREAAGPQSNRVTPTFVQ